MNSENMCIYHDDKGHFDVVSRDIEKAKIIPRQYARRLAMCICSCRRNRFDLNSEVKQLELQNMADYLQNCNTDGWPMSLSGLLKPLLKKVCIQQYSESMLIVVLYRAIKHQNYDLLESNKKRLEEISVKSKEQDKITQTQFNFMLNRKLRSSSCAIDVCLPLFAGNSNLLMRGDQMKQLQSKHKDIVIKIDHKSNTEYMEKNLKKTKIKIAGKSKQEVDKFSQSLKTIAAHIQDVQDRKHAVAIEKRKELKSLRKSYQESYHHYDNTNTWGYLDDDYKEDMTDLYTRRWTADRIGHKTKTEGDSPLRDGHCINCLEKFTTLKSPRNCKYHPGFIDRDRNWSCCSIEAESEQPSLQEHKKTGCFTGVHNWRHGKDIKKTKKHRNVTKTFKATKQNGRKLNSVTDVEY